MPSSPATKSVSVILICTFLITSCAETFYSTSSSQVVDSEKLLSQEEAIHIQLYPDRKHPQLTLAVDDVTLKRAQRAETITKHVDNSGTRIGGFVTIVLGGILALMISNGVYDEDTGTRSEPDPDAARSIFIGSLVLGAIMAIIPDSKKDSVTTSWVNYEEHHLKPANQSYLIWSETDASHVVLKKTNEEGLLTVDLLEDLKLNYLENQDSVQISVKPSNRTGKIHTIHLNADLWLKRTIYTIEERLNAYYAPSTSSPVAYSIPLGTMIKPLKKIKDWYKINFNGEVAYVHQESLKYHYALD